MRRLAVIASSFFVAGFGLAAVGGPASADPKGNNGTVKIDGEAFDVHPDNQPHPGCVFEVDFYGYDAGDLSAEVIFEAQSPTGKRELLLHDDGVSIGEDAASGGTDLDSEQQYDLSESLADFPRHDKQGYHVKLTVHAEGSQGADTKHKVFWVDCGSDDPDPDPEEPVGPSGDPDPSPTTLAPSPTTTAVTPASVTPSTTPAELPFVDSDPPRVVKLSASRDLADPVEAPEGELPMTGSDIGRVLAAGLALVGAGAATVVVARRRRDNAGDGTIA